MPVHSPNVQCWAMLKLGSRGLEIHTMCPPSFLPHSPPQKKKKALYKGNIQDNTIKYRKTLSQGLLIYDYILRSHSFKVTRFLDPLIIDMGNLRAGITMKSSRCF